MSHHSIHLPRDTQGKKVVTVKDINVYIVARRYVFRVLESTFHCFQGYTIKGEQAQTHDNLGMHKPRKHTLQATSNLKCVLEKLEDHMRYDTHILPFG